MLPLSIARRFLLSNKVQSTLIIVAISIGIAVQLFIGLLIQSLQLNLLERTVGSSSHITIETSDSYFKLDDNVLNELSNIDSINTVSPILLKDAIIQLDDEYGIVLNGVDFENDIFKLEDKIVEGSVPVNDDEIIISTFYDADVGDNITVTTVSNGDKDYKVVGIYDFENATVNEFNVYITLNSLQEYLEQDGYVSKVYTQIDNVFDSEEIADEINLNEYDVVTWQEENSSLLSALKSQGMSSYIIQVAVVVAVMLTITSILIISVTQKSRQIGILKAMGFSDKRASRVFILQGLLLGVVGSILGIMIAIGLLYMFTTFAVDENGNAVVEIYFSENSILLSFVIGTISAVLASIFPGRRSKKLSVIEVISNG